MDTDDRRPLRIDRSYDAPVDRVFRAWTARAELARWVWGSLGKDVVADVDLRVGGELREEHRKGWANAFDVLEACLCGA